MFKSQVKQQKKELREHMTPNAFFSVGESYARKTYNTINTIVTGHWIMYFWK